MPTRIIALMVSLLVLPLAAQAPSPRELFERARLLEESGRNLDDAIVLYTQVSTQSNERELAAAALLRVGLLHERLGRKAEAERAFKSVVANYADQPGITRQARERLPSDSSSAGAGGLSTRLVWDSPGGAPFGSPSPDGRYLSFTDWTSGGGGDLAIRDLATGTSRRLINGGPPGPGAYAYGSRFSPDGVAIVFNWIREDPSSFELRTVRVDTLEQRVLYRNDQLQYFQPFDWSQNGARILMLFNRLDGTNQIATISVADGSARILKTLDWRQPGGMAFSPDGRWIVYDFPPREDARERDVFVLATDGTRETRLVDHAADDFVLGWAPDGKTVLFASDRTGTHGAWTVHVADGKPAGAPQLVRADIGSRLMPMGFTTNGNFYYFATTAVSDVYTATIDLSSGRPVNPPAPLPGRFVGTNEVADWSSDGRFLAVLRQPPGLAARQILIRSATGGDERELRPDLGALTTWLRWSPDNRSMLVSGRDRRNRAGIFRIDTQTGAVTDLLRPEPRSLRPEWDADGKSFFYLRKDATCSCIMRRDLSDGSEVEIFRMPRTDRMVTMAPSADGRYLAVLWFGPPGRSRTLTLVPAAGGDARVLYEGDDLAWFQFVTWTPDSRDVLFGRFLSEPGKVAVWRVPAGGGELTPLGLAMEGLRDLRISPDGSRVVFTAGQNKGEVWVMENFLRSAQDQSSAGRP